MFSKLKSIKSYLRSIMSQEILNGLFILSTERCDVSTILIQKNFIINFASKKSGKKTNFK